MPKCRAVAVGTNLTSCSGERRGGTEGDVASPLRALRVIHSFSKYPPGTCDVPGVVLGRMCVAGKRSGRLELRS